MTALKMRDTIVAGARVAPLRLPARDEVEALVQLCEQARDLARVVLEVAVDRDDDLALGVREPGGEGGRLAEVAAQADDLRVRGPGVEPRQRGERAVLRAVVDEDRLPGLAARLERGVQLVVEEGDASLLVVNGDDDRDHGSEPSRVTTAEVAEAAGEAAVAAEVAAAAVAAAAEAEAAEAVEAEAVVAVAAVEEAGAAEAVAVEVAVEAAAVEAAARCVVGIVVPGVEAGAGVFEPLSRRDEGEGDTRPG